jgi:hypothetical protein
MSALFFRRWSTRLSVLAILAGVLSGCATISTGSHFDETVNFGAYKSFSWIDDEPLISAGMSMPVSALSESMINAAIRRELENKGYTFTEVRASADFVVAYTIGTRDAIRVDSYPVDYRGPWGWHVPYSYYHYRELSAHTYTTGTLGVDIFDNESDKPVWHGWAEKVVTQDDRKDPGPTIDAGVSKLFESFPP